MAEYSDFLECPICLEKYQTPRTLPCLHTFCEECLDSFIMSSSQNGSVFFCPICRKSTTPLETKLKVEEWARSFPLNHMIVSLMDCTVKHLGSKTLCDSCKNKGQKVAAEIWCEDCAAAFCRDCHKLMPIACGHKTTTLEEAGKCETKIRGFDEGCSQHPNKTLEVFCLDHRELCCVLCFAKSHRECKSIKDIDDISKEELNNSVASYFKKIKAKIETIVDITGENIDKIGKDKSSLIKDMESMVSNAKRKLDQLLKSYADEVSDVHTEALEQLNAHQKQVRGFITNIENCCKVMDVVVQRGSPRQIFLTFEQLRSQITWHFHRLRTVFAEDKDLSINVQIEDTMKTFADNLKNLGTVQISTAPSAVGDIISEVNNMMDNIVYTDLMADKAQQTSDKMKTTVTFVKAISSEELGTPFLTAGTFLRNGNLLLVDRCDCRLIELNEEWKVIKSHQIQGSPSAISQAGADDKIWVTLLDKKAVQQYEVKNDLILLSRITLKEFCFGVEGGGDVVIIRTRKTIEIYSKNGSPIRSIKTALSSGYITFSSKTKTLYHFDGLEVTGRDKSDNKLFTFQTKPIGRLRGMALDAHDNIYMCGKDTGKVYHLSADGKTCRILVDKLNGITTPECIVIHPRKNLFAVTSFKENIALEVYIFNNLPIEDEADGF